MRTKLLIAAASLTGAVLLNGCSTPLSAPMLIFPDVTGKTPLMSVRSIKVRDVRDNKALAVINGEAAPATPDLTTTLENWLNESISVNRNGRLSLDINIQNYASYVKQDAMHFNAESMMAWQVQLSDDKGFSWTKPYQSTINQTGAMTMSKREIEAHLNKMANNLLRETLKDPEFQSALSYR